MTEQEPAPEDEIGARFFEHALELWVTPALAKRQAAGEINEGQRIALIQVLFFPDDRPVEVRINAEVKGTLILRNDSLTPGEAVHENDARLNEVCGLDLVDEERDCGHVTILLLRDVKRIIFDFQRNRGVTQAHVDAAKEFHSIAQHALDAGHVRGFVDNLYSAADLAVKAFLLSTLVPTFRAKRHNTIQSKFNELARPGNVHSEKTDAFNSLVELRRRARYPDGAFELEQSRARTLLATIADLIASVDRAKTNFATGP